MRRGERDGELAARCPTTSPHLTPPSSSSRRPIPASTCTSARSWSSTRCPTAARRPRRALRALLERRLGAAAALPPAPLGAATGGVRWPAWVEDERFDDASARSPRARLPRAGRRGRARGWAGEFFSQRLDRARPLWEMALVEGLAGRSLGARVQDPPLHGRRRRLGRRGAAPARHRARRPGTGSRRAADGELPCRRAARRLARGGPVPAGPCAPAPTRRCTRSGSREALARRRAVARCSSATSSSARRSRASTPRSAPTAASRSSSSPLDDLKAIKRALGRHRQRRRARRGRRRAPRAAATPAASTPPSRACARWSRSTCAGRRAARPRQPGLSLFVHCPCARPTRSALRRARAARPTR